MTPETLEALDASIKHWQRNARADTPDCASTKAKDCALCSMFYEQGNSPCYGCPIYIATGKGGCEGTPYHEAHHWLRQWRDPEDERGAIEAEAGWRRETIAELSFLKALRPIGVDAP